jgi:hypothetical protein
MMGPDDSKAIQRPFRVGTVRGEPYKVGKRTLIPVARTASFGKAKATIGRSRVGGWGSGLVWITPVGMMEETAEGEHLIAVRDATATTLLTMLAAAIAITLFFTTIRCLAKRCCQAGTDL